MARLADPRICQFGHGLARGCAEFAPEVVSGGVGFPVLLQVGTHALAERIHAEKAFDHPHHRCAFPIGDDVEAFGCLFGVGDGKRDGMGGHQSVELKGALEGSNEVAPEIPLRVELSSDLGTNERGERLVEPQIVPPSHGHQVAPPHVSEFVGCRGENGFARANGGSLRVGRNHGEPVGNGPWVFHGPGLEIR
ncbi:hypothetical protein HRbin30_02430 [bacterium HR30]|nr:hypothetical protein HRbin30_02430 [bacterium HR30]